MNKIALVVMRPESVKLVLANAENDKYFYVFDEYVEKVRIGVDLEVDGILKAPRIAETIKLLKTYKKICEMQHIEKIYAYCTNFVSDAKNQRSFLEEIDSACGLQMRILSENEEANYLYYGIVNTLDISRGIIISVEDTETYLIKFNRRNIIAKEVVPYGTKNLSELLISSEKTPQENCEDMCEFMKQQIQKVEFMQKVDDDYQYVGVGKIFHAIGKLSRKLKRYPIEIEHNYQMVAEDITQVYDFVKVLDIDKPKKLKGISSDRADILASGLCIVQAVVSVFPLPNIIVSMNGMQAGILFENVIPKEQDAKIASDMLIQSVDSLSQYLPISRKNGAKILDLSMLIFKQLRVLHKLTRTYVRAMKIASYLVGCGEMVNFYNMSKSSFGIVSNLPIWGATHKEILLASFIVSSINYEDFNLSEWVKYKEVLTDYDLDAVRKLSAILKIAKGLDITQRGSVTDIVCDVLGDSVIMKTTSEFDVSFEVQYGLQASQDFKRAFGKNLEIL